MKTLSWLVAVLLAVGAPMTSAAEDTVAPKPRRRAAAKKAPPAPAPKPAPEPAPEPVASPTSAPPEAPAPTPTASPPAPTAPPSATTTPEPPPPPPDRLQRPGDLDLRVHLQSDILLAFVELGVAADFGVLPLGPGALALGGELSAGVCLTACGLIGLVTSIDVSDRFYSPHVRATYHFLPPNQKLDTLDLYGLVLAGVTVSTQTLSGTIQGVSFSSTGTGVGPSVGLGVGVKRFFKERIFLGGEARLRYARGEYRYSDTVAGLSFEGVDLNWSQTGFGLLLFGGARF